jgi:hypothetical protein
MTKKKEGQSEESVPMQIESNNLPALRPDQLKITRKLTLDIASIGKIQEIVMMCQGELELVELPSKFAENGKSNAYVIDVLDVFRGLEIRLTCNAILERELKRFPPPLKGQMFAVRVGEMVPGKRYRDTQVFKVELKG